MTRADCELEPFRIQVDQSVLDDLQMRLRRARRTSLSQDSWNLGTNPDYLREILEYWQSSYRWREHEAALNDLAQFKARVGDTDMHFVHERGADGRATPLLLLHGWPDSFCRFRKVIPKLVAPTPARRGGGRSFDVVAPSLPGFAFTEPHLIRTQPNRHSAELLWSLMTEVLGYERFMVAGGDGGSVLAQIIAIDHPESVLGVHLTDLGWHAYDVDPESLSSSERTYLDAAKKQLQRSGAYALVQRTRPRSLAAGLNDSPVGLASWILDRFHDWCDFDRDLEQSVSRDDLLTNIMLYWVTQTIGSSMFSYYGEGRSPSLTRDAFVERPVGMALFPKDIGGIPPRSFAQRTLDVQHWSQMPRGGHFAALEVPESYVRDLIAFREQLTGIASQKETRHVASNL